jgi:hypothetical protein
MLRFAPVASLISSTQETFVFWQEKNTSQSLIGVYGQKFSSTGTRLWNDAGVAFKPLDGNSFSSLTSYTKDTNVFVYYLELGSGSNGLIKAFKTGPSSAFGWGGSIITPGSLLSSKTRMSVALSPNGMSMLSWQDGRNDGGGIYAQNINLDGTFGNPSGITPVSGNLPERFSLHQNFPNPFNPSTKIKFDIPSMGTGSMTVKLIVYDILGNEVSRLIDGEIKAGEYEFSLDASGYSSGVYFYKLTVFGDGSNPEDFFTDTKKMIMVK